MDYNENQKFVDMIRKIVLTELKNEGLLTGQWHLGTVDSVVSSTKLKVFVDGSTVSQTIPCNPKVTFTVGDKVYVLFINGSSTDKFVPFHRGI